MHPPTLIRPSAASRADRAGAPGQSCRQPEPATRRRAWGFRLLGLVAVAGLASSQAWAGPEELFTGLIPGQVMTDDELGEHFGKGLEITVDGSSIFGPNGSTISADELSTISDQAFSDSSGILQITQFHGDNNVVVMEVDLTINIGTVTLMDSNGNTITNMPTLDLSGQITGISNLHVTPTP